MKSSLTLLAAADSRRTVRSTARHLLALLAALSLLLVSTAVWAEPAAVRDALPRASLEFDRSVPTPGVDGTDTHLGVVHWAAPANRGSLGLSVGVGAWQPSALPGQADSAVRWTPEIGVRWRSAWRENHRVDVGAYGGYAAASGLPADERRDFNTRVELQFRNSHSRFGFDGASRALGLQLGAHSQMMLRTRHGGPMLYYRSQW